MRTQILMFTLSTLRVEVSPDNIWTIFYLSKEDTTGRQKIPDQVGICPKSRPLWFQQAVGI